MTTTSTVTCQSCDFTVLQNARSKRTICPNCGLFYNRQSAQCLPQQSPRRNLVSLQTDHTQNRDRQNGRLHTMINFFQNLTTQRKSSQQPKDHSSRGTDELPPIGKTSNPSYSIGSHNISPGRSLISPSKNRICYPVRTKTVAQLVSDISKAKETGDMSGVNEFYSTSFCSFLEINATYKKDTSKDYRTLEDSGINAEFVNSVYDLLKKLPNDTQKALLKAIIKCLAKDRSSVVNVEKAQNRSNSKDELRAYLVLLQNPQFGNTSTYVIFAHLLRQISALTDNEHHYLVHWLKKLTQKTFKEVLDRLQSFVACRLFPPKQKDLPRMANCAWWVPSATKVIALLNAANKLTRQSIVPYTDFYNSALDHLDLMAEYYAWQNPSSHAGFSFCQYPFMLSITAKRTILQRDAEQQMIITARRSLVAKVQRRQLPDMGMLFLNLTVRRSHLVSDSLNEISRKHVDLKKKLKVTFSGEPGLDMGGLTKEWFLLLIKQIYRPEYGMFIYNKKAGVYWFTSAHCENYSEFNLVGVLMGLAVYNSIILDMRLPAICYKKLLNPAVVPYNNPKAVVGRVSADLDQLKQIQPEVAQGLKDLLDYDGDVEEDFGLTFQITYSELCQIRTHPLKVGGDEVPVTSENRIEYVKLYVDWVINKSVYYQFQAFYHGFHGVCASNALIMLRSEEIEMLVCGSPTVDFDELRKITTYEGYTVEDPIIKLFWECVCRLPLPLQKQLMLFTTGSDRIPVGGMSDMLFKITRVDGLELLPMSHTCFNQLLLPAYNTKQQLKVKLLTAIQNSEGFGLE